MSDTTQSSNAPADAEKAPAKPDVPLTPRIPRKEKLRAWLDERFDWSWFTATQSTGGFAIALSECPRQFHGLKTIGSIIFIFNLVMFAIFTTLMVTRFVMNPGRLRKSLTVAPECFFFGSYWLTIAGIIMCMNQYGVPHTGDWLITTVRVLFWMYGAATFVSTTLHFIVIFKYTTISAVGMNPGWFFLIFNSMLTGTVAATIAGEQPPDQRWPILVAGVAYQGLGWLVSMLILGWFLGTLMEKGWPEPSKTPGLFITIGTAGYTIVALIGCARNIPEDYGYFATHPMAAEILRVLATWIGIFMWLFNLWLFSIAFSITIAESVRRKDGKWELPMTFNNTWWALIFPNVGFTIATVYIGQDLESSGIEWIGVGMILALAVIWILDLVLMSRILARAIFQKQPAGP